MQKIIENANLPKNAVATVIAGKLPDECRKQFEKLEITDDFMTKDGVEIEPGVYLLQILLYDNDKGHGRVTIPPVEFEILAPIFKDKEGTDNEGALFSLDDIEVDE